MQILNQLSFILLLTLLFSCGTVQVYKDPARPFYYSTHAKVKSKLMADSLNVITFNIKKSEKIQLAASELLEFDKTGNVDIYLLQEMDERGVEAIAEKLGLNYLYIPIVFDKAGNKNIGNAILTKGTIQFPQKLILPHSKRMSKRPRHVTIGEIHIHQKKILVYSVHTETVMMTRKKRMEQIDTILEHAMVQSANYKYVLIGGDFNTLFSRDGQMAVEKFNDKGFDWPTASVGTTATAFFGLVKPRHDYFFSSGLKMIHAGKIESSKSSDHLPVFASFRF